MASDGSVDGTEQTERDSCSVVGCPRESATTVAYSHYGDLPRDLPFDVVKSNDDAIILDLCIQCRRAFDFGKLLSNTFVEDWESDELNRKFKAESCVIHRSVNTATDQSGGEPDAE